jgi:folylpolyglutamate synthase/dihydropteroate synthase
MAGAEDPAGEADLYVEAVKYVFANAQFATSESSGIGPADYWRRFDRLLTALGRPELDGGRPRYAVVHIAGTNGKGTTSTLCAALLEGAGAGPVGLFTSPHLHSWRERFRVDGRLATRAQLVASVAELRAAEASLATAGGARGALTPFEKLTALAILVFRDAGVRCAVFETGLGGRWDCTNHIVADRAPPTPTPTMPTTADRGDAAGAWPTPLRAGVRAPPAVVGLCRVGLDHVAILGGSVEAIASEKAGILKARVAAFSAPQRPEASAVLRATATARGAVLVFPELDDPDVLRAFALAAAAQAAAAGAAAPRAGDADADARALPPWLRPPHQQHNLALAISLVRALLAEGDEQLPRWTPPVAERALRAALGARCAGRLEIVVVGGHDGGGSLVGFDVAHNEDAIHALLAHIGTGGAWHAQRRADAREDAGAGASAGAGADVGAHADADATTGTAGMTLVFGVNRDKDARTLLGALGAFATAGGGARVRSLQLVASAHPKSVGADALLAIAVEVCPHAPWRVARSVEAAVDEATGAAAPGAAADGADGGGAGSAADARRSLFLGSGYVVAEARARLAQTHPRAFAADDWAFDGLAEPQLGVLAAAT